MGQASEPASASAGVTDVSAVLRSAVQWATALDLDPIRIRDELGMKGIKHWTEFLCLLTYAAGHFDSETANEAREVAARFAPRVLQPTYSNFTLLPTTHKAYRADSMSWVRAYRHLRVMEAPKRVLGPYWEAIQAELPKIHSHLPKRGVDQRLGFHSLFEELGIETQDDMPAVFQRSLIYRRRGADDLCNNTAATYQLTHEIFALTTMGLKPIRFPGIDPVSEQHAQLVSHALETVEELLRRRMALGVRKSSMSVDAACELAVNVAQLRRAATPLLGEARDFILAHRNEDGSVGEFQWLEARNRVQKGNPRWSVTIGATLHCTVVCMWALRDIEYFGLPEEGRQPLIG